MANQKTIKRTVRRNRIRAKVSGTAVRPRLSVFKSNTALYAQLIDDKKGATLAAVNSRTLKVKGVAAAIELGKLIGEKAAALKITEVVFDRGGYIYTGQISALADAARKAGLKF